jgi:hypothetical protein
MHLCTQAHHKSLRGNSRALATVSAIIDGTGSIGAAVGPFMAGALVWNQTFYMLMASVFISALVVLFALFLLVVLILCAVLDPSVHQGDPHHCSPRPVCRIPWMRSCVIILIL